MKRICAGRAWFASAAMLVVCGSTSAQSLLTTDADIVPGRYIVVYRQPPTALAAQHVAAAGGRILRWHAASSIAVASTADGAAFEQQMRGEPEVRYVLHDRIVHANTITIGRVLQPVTARPIRSPETEQPAAPASLTGYYYADTPQGWAVKQVGGYGGGIAGSPHGPWDVTMGRGVRIAVLDSGVDETHPSIAPNLALNLSEIDQTALPSACDDGSAQDQQGHGTWVASLAAGSASEGEVIGVAPQATILNIKVMQRMPATGSGTAESLCEGGEASGLLSWVLSGIADAVANHADVIVLSLGVMVDLDTGEGAGLMASFNSVTYAATQAGAVLVAAAGNDGYAYTDSTYAEIPAQSRGVLAVAATTNPACAETAAVTDPCVAGPSTVAYYSNRGAMLDALAAPGGSYPEGPDAGVSGFVRGACSRGLPDTADGLPGDGAHSFGCFALGHTAYVQAMGTSASAPLAAGVAALLRAAHPEWDVATLLAQMRASAIISPQLTGAGVGGMVNAAAALGM